MKRIVVLVGLFLLAPLGEGQECCCESDPIEYLTEDEAPRIAAMIVRYIRFEGDPLHPATIRIGAVSATPDSFSKLFRLRLLVRDQSEKEIANSPMFRMVMLVGRNPPELSDVTFCESSDRLESIEDRRQFEVVLLGEDGEPLKYQPRIEHETLVVAEPPGSCDPGWNPELQSVAGSWGVVIKAA